ncbi:MAG: bifunctional oligoribonuclease/PAP phosphatase NrnA [Armatimonadetes bacterium]|nr:bifunctional oligoribonuclease/PAP phosphatase NrnA [Armatimonadota bacterium]
MTTESNPPLTSLVDRLLECLSESRDVLIGTHLNPDGDAIGSALAVSLWLDKKGIPNEVLCHNMPPGYLQFLPGSGRVRQVPSRSGHDLGIVVDLDSLERLGSCRASFEAFERLVLIDHHQPHESPGTLRIVDPKAPATAAILCDLFAEVGRKTAADVVDADMADCLLTGLLTDTGSFRFPNATAHSLHQAGWLLEHGASLTKVADEVYLNRDEPAVRLLGEAIRSMRMDCDGRLAWVVLTPETFQAFHAEEEHTEGIVNEILSVRSVRAAFVLRAGKYGKVKGSLRSKGGLDVAKVAQQIGGGGHKNAAGVTIDGTLDEAERIVVAALKEALRC